MWWLDFCSAGFVCLTIGYAACFASRKYNALGLAIGLGSVVPALLCFFPFPVPLDQSEHGGPEFAAALCLLPVGFTSAVLLSTFSRRDKCFIPLGMVIASICIFGVPLVKSNFELASAPRVSAAYLSSVAQNGAGANIKGFAGRRIEVTGKIGLSTAMDGGPPQMGDVAIANLGLFDSFHVGQTVTIIGIYGPPIDLEQQGDDSDYLVELHDCRIVRKFAGYSFTL